MCISGCACVFVCGLFFYCNRLTREYCTETARLRNIDVTRDRLSGSRTTYTMDASTATTANVIKTEPKIIKISVHKKKGHVFKGCMMLDVDTFS